MSAVLPSPQVAVDPGSFWAPDPGPPADLDEVWRCALRDALESPFGTGPEDQWDPQKYRRRLQAIEQTRWGGFTVGGVPAASTTDAAPHSSSVALATVREESTGVSALNEGGLDDSAVAAALAAPRKQQTYEEYIATQARVPRRGELGVTPEQVQQYQNMGYVMSGSRRPEVELRLQAVQKEMHKKMAGTQHLDFVAEEQRRAEEKALDDFQRIVQQQHLRSAAALRGHNK